MAQTTRSPRLGHSPFRLGDWLVDPTLCRIFRGDTMVHLELRPMDVLVSLAAHATSLVTRLQLMDEVWGSLSISDNTLTRAIADLRSALNDDARRPSYIETIHRRGYRSLQTPRPQTAERQHSFSARDRIWTETSRETERW
jgi:DNA-binding winged helix-turn-helix (wHTH) protein